MSSDNDLTEKNGFFESPKLNLQIGVFCQVKNHLYMYDVPAMDGGGEGRSANSGGGK